MELDFFKEIIRMAAHHGTMVVHDFAYADIGFDGYQLPEHLHGDGAKEVAVEIFSLSKSYNMAGLYCCGFGSNLNTIGALARIKSYLDYGVFQPVWIARSSCRQVSMRKTPRRFARCIRSAVTC